MDGLFARQPATHYVALIAADFKICRDHAARVNTAHAGQASSRYLSSTPHDSRFLGNVGEMALDHLLRRPHVMRFLDGQGDGGMDNIINDKRVDVKCALKPRYLIVPVGEVKADRYILAGFDEPVIGFYGWATADEVLAAPTKRFMKGGPVNHYIPAAQLHSMTGVVEASEARQN